MKVQVKESEASACIWKYDGKSEMVKSVCAANHVYSIELLCAFYFNVVRLVIKYLIRYFHPKYYLLF